MWFYLISYLPQVIIHKHNLLMFYIAYSNFLHSVVSFIDRN